LLSWLFLIKNATTVLRNSRNTPDPDVIFCRQSARIERKTLDLRYKVARGLRWQLFPHLGLLRSDRRLHIFIFWVLALIAAGFAAANPQKLRGARPYGIAFGVFAAYAVLRAGIALVFS